MRILSIMLALAALALCSQVRAGAEEKKPEEAEDQKGPEKKEGKADVELKTLVQKSSYAIGFNIGKNIGRDKLPLDLTTFVAGLKTGLAGEPGLMTEVEINQTMQTLQQEMSGKIAKQNQEQGQAFLEENKKKEGVVTLPSGLQYKVEKEGTGEMPTADSKVSTHYRGTLIDGTEFDSSYKRGQPATFPVKGVIKGWTEALLKMKVGSKWKLYIPAELAYGERPPPRSPIGPNSTLVFDIELLSIQK